MKCSWAMQGGVVDKNHQVIFHYLCSDRGTRKNQLHELRYQEHELTVVSLIPMSMKDCSYCSCLI